MDWRKEMINCGKTKICNSNPVYFLLKKQGIYLIQLNITEHKSHIREQARYAGRFSVRPHSSAQP